MMAKRIVISRHFKNTLGVKANRFGYNDTSGSYSYSTTVDDFLHKSKIPTDHFQRSMPHLPIPELSKTCTRYLAAQRPLLSDQEYLQTENIVKQFEQVEGKALNQKLVIRDKQNKSTSYITGPWFDMYLKDRQPVVLNHNPYMVFNDDPRPGYMNQCLRATNMIITSMRFMKTLRANLLHPEVYHLNPAKSDTETFKNLVRFVPKPLSWYAAYFLKAFPLDMSQYGSLFNSTRIPRLDKDELFTDKSARHLLVIRNGRYYTFDVINADGSIRSPEEMLANLQYITAIEAKQPESVVGYLTSENRDTWANVREQLIDAGNTDELSHIDRSLFALVLDDHEPCDTKQLCQQFLHGDAANRWFDKSFSLIFTKDGKAGSNFEHSWGDGVAVLRYFNEVYKETINTPVASPNTKPATNIDSSVEVKEIAFNLTPPLVEAIKSAKAKFENNIAQLKFSHMKLEEYGKNYIKKQKLSPDAIMQLAFQIAYYRLYGSTAATYESCSTAAFKHGRTETIRSCTAHTRKTTEMFEQKTNPPSVAELREMLTQCSNYHGQLTKEAAMGQGFDRHLFAMKHLASELGGELPELYRNSAHTDINHIILSTSTLTSPAILIGGFAPVVPNGFGVGYGIDDDAVGCNVTSYSSRDLDSFVDCIGHTLKDLYSVMQGHGLK